MSNTFPFVTINNLPDFPMIAGSNQDLIFNIYDSGSNLVDLNSATIYWRLAPYGQSTAILTKTASYSGSPVGQFIVALEPADTAGLSGRYFHQYSVTTISGSVYKDQGNMLIGVGLV